MEREILFRGKRKDNGKWVEGYLLKYSPIYEEKAYILPLHSVCASDIEVDPKTVCQYTGLTDKNGLQKIYECDIISENGERVGNLYEKENIQPGTSYIIIARMGTKEWENTKQERDRCGLRYAEHDGI